LRQLAVQMDMTLADALGVISLVLAVITFVTSFLSWKLNKKLQMIEDKLSGEWDDLWLLHNPSPYVPRKGFLSSILGKENDDTPSPS
jgi:hypothetical protein